MKKWIQVLVMLSLPAALLWLLFKVVINFIVANTTDYSMIGEKISGSVPYVLMVNHTVAFLFLLLLFRWSRKEFVRINIECRKMDIALGLGVGLLLFAIQQIILLFTSLRARMGWDDQCCFSWFRAWILVSQKRKSLF